MQIGSPGDRGRLRKLDRSEERRAPSELGQRFLKAGILGCWREPDDLSDGGRGGYGWQGFTGTMGERSEMGRSLFLAEHLIHGW